jgi:phosphoribosylamine---glycine ligase
VKIIVIGSGGREHALAWKLLQSPEVSQVFCIPGNGGTAMLPQCENISLALEDFAGISSFAANNGVDLVVVGPEYPLSLGISDYLLGAGITVFGPTQAGALIESSKSWAKELMIEAGVPTAASGTFTDVEAARDYIREQGAPIVVKADGLAAGKGVIVAETLEVALEAIEELFDSGFNKVVVEEFLVGEEVSILTLTDGIDFRCLLPAQDHKRIGEGDTGKNTGGMGVYAPAPVATEKIIQQVEREILAPVVATLQQRGIDYRGVLYAGLMISPTGEPKVLEFNCRFGDPETQAVLPLLQTPLASLLLACAQQKLRDFPPLQWQSGSAVCVVAAAAGYPDSYEKGQLITGIKDAESSGAIVFQAGTLLKHGDLFTDGGRVLGITAVGENFQQAIERAYQSVNLINFAGIYYRRDIGYRVRGK